MRASVKSGVLRADQQTEFETEERCFITEVANDQNDPELSMALARVEPGVTTAWHRVRDTAERYLIIQGSGFVEIGDSIAEHVVAGDVVRIAPDQLQRIRNSGTDDLLFYAICTPRFEQHNYIDEDG
ncbi:MAG: cupin domain-containing protein [Pseudomonadales bacterium]